MKWGSMKKSGMKKLKNLDGDDYLKMLGLQRRTPTSDFFASVGIFAAGALIGAGLGVLFAPKRGEEIRSRMGQAWKNRGRMAQDFAHDLGVEGAATPATPMTGSGSH